MLSPIEAKRLLSVVDGDRLAALYRVALTLGMRQAEILGLRWQDVDIDAPRLRVRQTLPRMGVVIQPVVPQVPGLEDATHPVDPKDDDPGVARPNRGQRGGRARSPASRRKRSRSRLWTYCWR